jgi:Skp family chaperone for outer membrane proteins
MKTSQLNKSALAGWFLAAGLLGTLLGSGFQNNAEKLAVVDLRQVILGSKLKKQTEDRVEAARKARLNVLTFIRDQRVISSSQCAKLKELELKETKTDAERTELDNLKKTVSDAAKEYETLVTLTSPTEPQRLRLIELNKLIQESGDILMMYQSEFENDFMNLSNQAQNDAIDKAAVAARAVAKSKGYTVVYSSSAVVYGANDITADATKEADK